MFDKNSKNIMKNIILLVLSITTTFSSYAQDKTEIKYRRSSLHLMMMDDQKLPEKDIIINTFKNYPFPDKYNDHKISITNIPTYNEDVHPWVTRSQGMTIGDLATLSVEDKKMQKDWTEKNKLAKAKLKEEKQKQKEADKLIKPTDEEKQRRKLVKSMKGVDVKIEKYFTENKIANKLVAKWFNINLDGSMNLDLIKERGQYDATEDDVKTAQMMSKSVDAQLKDAGVELIDKSFIVINKFKFIENEVAALIVYTAAKIAIDNMDESTAIAKKIKSAALNKTKQLYEKARQGYTVGTQAFLYKLNWSETTENVFKKSHWNKSSLAQAEKMTRLSDFNNSNSYKLEFVGMEKQTIRVLNLTSENLTKQQIIGEATRRTMNKVYAKLQKEYEVFKPRMPLISASKKDCTAKIGMKEGLSGGEKFEVLEKLVDKEGLTIYKSKGIIKVDKKQLWDNQFYASKSPTIKDGEVAIQATGFKGCKNSFYKGLLIKQLK